MMALVYDDGRVSLYIDKSDIARDLGISRQAVSKWGNKPRYHKRGYPVPFTSTSRVRIISSSRGGAKGNRKVKLNY